MGVVRVDLPQELIALLGESPERVADAARKALVRYLLRVGKLSQGKAGELLGVDRWGVLDLMVEHDIQSGPATRVSTFPGQPRSEAYANSHKGLRERFQGKPGPLGLLSP